MSAQGRSKARSGGCFADDIRSGGPRSGSKQWFDTMQRWAGVKLFRPYTSMPETSPQQTLAKSASLTGTALHTGEQRHPPYHPAAPGTGRKFKRSDLPDEPTIDARIENVKTVERATTIAEGNVKVHTVEHVLAALAGLGVDNAIIEMDANEPPIGDGSAQPYVELIKQARRRRRRTRRAPSSRCASPSTSRRKPARS